MEEHGVWVYKTDEQSQYEGSNAECRHHIDRAQRADVVAHAAASYFHVKSQTYNLRNVLKKVAKLSYRKEQQVKTLQSIHKSNSFHPPCPALHSPNSSNSSIQTMYLSQIPKAPIPTSTHTISSERAMRDENIMLTWDPLD